VAQREIKVTPQHIEFSAQCAARTCDLFSSPKDLGEWIVKKLVCAAQYNGFCECVYWEITPKNEAVRHIVAAVAVR
jgi:hypothetical protein